MKSLISFLALIWLAMGDPSRIAKDGYLDPGKVRWWKNSWAPNPIELSQTNSGTTGVTVTVHFRPQTSLPTTGNMGLAIVTVPSAFSTTTTYTSNSMAIVASTDTSFSFTLLTALPSAGVYGPFQIVTKTSSTGQIYDANYVFGCVAVSASVSASSTLTVSTVTLTPTTAIVGSSDGLYFTFTIPSGTNLWKHDIIEIVPDSRWTIPSSPTCASVDLSGTTNYIKGPKGDDSLPCAVAQSGGANGGYNTAKSSSATGNSIYIYGLSQDVIINSSYQVKLQVSSFTLPSSAVSASSFQWSLKIWRWGTTNLLAQFAGSGPLAAVAGAITVNSWVPYNSNVQTTDIPNASNAFYIFTKLTLQTAHPISSGSITINFSNANINGGNWWQDAYSPSTTGTKGLCYLNIYIKGVTCSVSSSNQVATITISSSSSGLAANTAISITLLTGLSTGAKVSSITSNDATSSTNVIDQFTAGYSWAFSSLSSTSYTYMNDFQFYAAAGTSPATGSSAGSIKYKDSSSSNWKLGLQIGGNLAASQFLMWTVSPQTTWVANYNLVVSLPISGSGVTLNQSYIKSTALFYDVVATSSSSSAVSLNSPSTSTSSGPKSGTPGSISITISSSYTFSSGNVYVFAYGDPSSTDTQVTALPYVTSNVATLYECWAKATPPSGSSSAVTEFFSYPYSVFPGSTVDTSLTYAPLCSDKYVGVPIYATFHALNLAFNFADTTHLYYLDISITGSAGSSIPTNLGSGLADGSIFPVVSTTSGITPNATITGNVVTISGLGSVSASTAVNLLIPNGNKVSLEGNLNFYYLQAGADPSIKMVLYTNLISAEPLSSSSSTAFSSASVTSPSGSAYTVGGASATTMSLTSSNAASNWIGIGLPGGFTLPSSYSLTLGTALTPYGVSSSSSTFTGGFVVGLLAASTTLSSTSFTLSSLNAPLSTGQAADANTNNNFVVYATSTIGAQCVAISTISSIKVSAATITADQCSITNPYTQGPDSVDSTLTLTFTTVNPIPAGGSIVITLSSSFTLFTSSSSLPFTTCQGVGFTDQSSTAPQKCVISSTTVTLSQFSQVAAGSVSVKISHVVPASTSGTSLACFTAVNTYNAVNGYLIDSATGLTNSVAISASSAVGTTNGSSFISKAYPNIAGAAADIYLTFSLSKSVPQYGLITITPGFVSSLTSSNGDLSSSCWTDQDYLSCQVVNSNGIQLQLNNALPANQAIRVYLDMALTLPTSNSTTAGWTISSSWGGVSITADSTSVSPATFQQTIGTAVSNSISLTSVLPINSQTANEATSYIFNFTSAVVVATTDTFVIEFPKDFSPLLGLADAVFPDCSPNNYYTTCSSTALGIASSTLCSVDHWKLTVTGITKATTSASANIDITVDMIQNPVAGTTNGKFSLYQYGSDGSIKAYIQKASAVTIASLASTSVYLKDSTVDVATLEKSATYTFDFYLSASTTFTTDYTISVYFPQQFNNKLRNGSTVPCKSVFFDESSSSTSTNTSQPLSSATSCSVSGYNVTLGFPSSLTAATATTSRIQLQLTGFYNPESGISRSAGWDVTDYGTFSSTKYDQFSNKFAIAVNQNSKVQIYAESSFNLNSAYIGYSIGYGSGYSTSASSSSSRIGLLPGQQSSDITVSILDSNNWPMKSKSFKLSPTTNLNYPDSGNLKYTSAYYGFTVYQMVPQFNFRVAASSSTVPGIYYIDWGTPVEKLQNGVSNPLYVAPLSMMIEVCSSLSAISVIVDPLPTLYQYYTSLPIRVSLPNAPASQLIVTPAFSVAGISISPASLTFGPDLNVLYFQVLVGSSYVASTSSPTLSFTLSGTDAAAFIAPSKMTATISATNPSIVTATAGLSATKVSSSEFKISVTTTVPGVLYWGLGCQGSWVPTFAGLSGMVSDLVNPSSSIQTLQEQLAYQYQNTETDIDPTKDADINAFFRRMHSQHCSEYWASAQVISTSGATIDLNWLMAGTNYTFSAYIATKLTNNTSSYPLSTYNFTTDAAGQYYSTSVTFSGTVTASSSGNIANVLAKNMGVNPSWLTYVSSSNRILQTSSGSGSTSGSTTTTFTYNVLSDSRYPAYTSSSMISNLNANQAQATSDFTSLLSLTATTLGTSTAISTGITPSWSTAPAKTSVADTSATFTTTSSQAGTIYATCSSNNLSGYNTYAWQVTNGLDATTEKVPSANVASVAATSENITVSGLTAGTAYVCYFTACNNYPVTPSCIDYTSTTPLPSISFNTTGSSNNDSSAVIMGASAALAVILTLLN